MRLLAIIIGCTVALLISLASVHFYGLGQKYRPFEHKFLSPPTPWVIAGWEQSFFQEKSPNLILLAQVYKNKDGAFLVAPSREKVSKNSEREQVASPSRPLLNDFLKQFPTQRLVLIITDNVEDIDLQIAKILEGESKSERILIQSDFNLVLESIKKQQPMLLYGGTPSDIMRFKSFQSIGILTAVPFKGDIYFAPLRLKKRETINSGINEELVRRYKKVILGPLHSKDEVELALSLGADGLYVENPEDALQVLSQKPR